MEASHDRGPAEAIEQLAQTKLTARQFRLTGWTRIIKNHHRNDLGFSPSAESRFSDPGKAFGAVYAAAGFRPRSRRSWSGIVRSAIQAT